MNLMNHNDDWPSDREMLGPAMGCLAIAGFLAVACVLGLLKLIKDGNEWMGR